MSQVQQTRHLLMLPLPRALQVRIEDRYLPSVGATRPSMGYHISIVGPFFWRDQDTDAALETIARVCAATKPLRISLHHADVFRNAPDDNGVFIAVRPVWALRRLHRRLRRALRQEIALQHQYGGLFRPHITLGLNLPAPSRDTLLRSARKPLDSRFEAAELWLMEQRPQDPWRPLFSFALGRDEPPHPLHEETGGG